MDDEKRGSLAYQSLLLSTKSENIYIPPATGDFFFPFWIKRLMQINVREARKEVN